jgi:hypothetical protein
LTRSDEAESEEDEGDDGDDLVDGVGGTHSKAGPLIEVGLGVNSERSGDGTHHGRLRDVKGNDDGAEEIRKEDARAGRPNGDRAAKKEASACD